MDLEDKRESLLEMGTMRMDREGAISDDGSDMDKRDGLQHVGF